MPANSDFNGCQLPCVPKFANGPVRLPFVSIKRSVKQFLSFPWNSYIKRWLKNTYSTYNHLKGISNSQITAEALRNNDSLNKGDFVIVRSREEIESTLDPFKELKGCAFLPDMYNYCGTRQRVFRSMQHFIDERDYKLKKTRGIILLENVYCTGTVVFGPCDRSCFLFWREEWLKKIEQV